VRRPADALAAGNQPAPPTMDMAAGSCAM